MRTKIVANFIKSGTKAGGTGEPAEATHRIVALFNIAMVLLNAVVQVLIGSMKHFTAKDAMNSPLYRPKYPSGAFLQQFYGDRMHLRLGLLAKVLSSC